MMLPFQNCNRFIAMHPVLPQYFLIASLSDVLTDTRLNPVQQCQRLIIDLLLRLPPILTPDPSADLLHLAVAHVISMTSFPGCDACYQRPASHLSRASEESLFVLVSELSRDVELDRAWPQA